MASQAFKISKKHTKSRVTKSKPKSQYYSQALSNKETEVGSSQYSPSSLPNYIGNRTTYTITKQDVNKFNLLSFCEHLKSSSLLNKVTIKFSEIPVNSIIVLIKSLCQLSNITNAHLSDLNGLKKFNAVCANLLEGTFIENLEFKNAYFSIDGEMERSTLFASMITTNPRIVVLELTYCLINDTALKVIIPSMQSVINLNLSYNNLRNSGIKSLTDFFSNPSSLKFLSIDQTGFDSSVLTYIANFLLKSSSITNISLEQNGIKAKGLLKLFQPLNNRCSIQVIKCKIREFDIGVAKSIVYFTLKQNTKVEFKVGNLSKHRIFYRLSRVTH